jgi:hypothetical protein
MRSELQAAVQFFVLTHFRLTCLLTDVTYLAAKADTSPRINKNSATFIDKRRGYNVKPYINGLSDHDAQLIILVNSNVPNDITESISIRNINTNNILEFQMLLSREQWDNIFGNNDVNNMFNNFHNIYI